MGDRTQRVYESDTYLEGISWEGMPNSVAQYHVNPTVYSLDWLSLFSFSLYIACIIYLLLNYLQQG